MPARLPLENLRFAPFVDAQRTSWDYHDVFVFLFVLLFFSLDRKEPKDQGCIEKAKSFFAGAAVK
jgi:hypothetical protein